MTVPWRSVGGWAAAVAMAAAPWVALRVPEAVPVLVAFAVLVAPVLRPRAGSDPWGGALEAVSGLAAAWAFLPAAAAGLWSALAVTCAALRLVLRGRDRGLHPADALAAGGWGILLAAVPGQLAVPAGWLGATVALVAVRRLALWLAADRVRRQAPSLGPPSREVRGRLELDGFVGATPSGLPAARPVDLVVEPGQSVALLLDRVSAAASLVEAVLGRRPPAAGEVRIDGERVGPGERLVAAIAPGEPFVPGGLEENIAALCPGPVGETQMTAAVEACALDEVTAALERGGAGETLRTVHRMLLLAARVLVSPYRIVLVVDPEPWVNTVTGEIWRRAVVRASVGRTALWITSDRELASRADRLVVLRAGVLAEEEAR